MKELFNIKATKPKIEYLWNFSLVFEYFEKGPADSGLIDKVFSQKVVVFLLLLGVRKVNTSLSFYVQKMIVNNLSVTYVL